jgi:Carboxypeptidase regulatory-like domain
MNRRLTIFALTGLACTVVAMPAMAQSSQTSGAVRGTVKAKKGGVVAGASLVLRNVETGFSRTVSTDASGAYLFSLMPVGNYELNVSAPGQRSLKDGNVRVGLGESTVLNFDLDSADAGATVEVVAAAEALDKSQVITSTSIDSKLVESIPLNGRNFTDLVNLTPGAAPDPDAGRVSVEGARGIQNNLTIDGASYNSNFFGEQRGSTRIPFAFGADTIKELQIITNAFDAQYGNAAGAVINAVSKTGTNEFSGSTLFQWRPKSLVAKIRPVPYDTNNSNTDQARTKNFTQIQLNVNVGGPIIKDKLHYFVGVESYSYREDFTPDFGTDASGNSIAQRDVFLSNLGGLIVGNDGRTLAQEGGRSYTNDRKNTVFFGRLDWSVSENHRLTLRLNAQDWKSENGTTSFQSSFAPTTGQTNQGLEKNSGLSWVLEWNAILNQNMVNEFRIQRAIERRPRLANTQASPEFQVNGGFTAGQNNFLPNGLDEKTWQIIDNLTWTKGDWLVKGGLDLQFFDFNNTFFRFQNGAFAFGNYGVANRWFSGTVATGDTLSYTGSQSDFDGTIQYKSKLFATYVQSQYQGLLDHRLTLNLGLRFTKEQQPDNPRPNPLLAGLDQANSPSSVDPRFGFTYDLDGNGRTLLRGGYGWFSSPSASLTVSNTMSSNGQTTSTYVIRNAAGPANALFNPGGLLSYGQRVSGNSISRLDPALLGGLSAISGRQGQVWDPNNKMAVAKRTALGVEHIYENGLKLGIQGVYARFENLQYFVNINLAQRAFEGSSAAPVVSGAFYNDGYPTNVNNFSNSNALRPGFAIVRGRRLEFANGSLSAPFFGDVFLSKSDGEGSYRALILTAEKRSSNGWGFSSNVTFSVARDNNSNERSTASAGADSNTNNPADPLSTSSFSDNDRPFRLVFATYFPIVWEIQGAVNFSYTSGRPYSAFNVSRGSVSGDLNGDGSSSNDYALGTQRNGARQPHVKTLDLRLSRNFVFPHNLRLEVFTDVFNVFNWANQRTTRTALTSGNLVGGLNPVSDYSFINVPDRNTREVQLGARLRF